LLQIKSVTKMNSRIQNSSPKALANTAGGCEFVSPSVFMSMR